MSQIYLGQDGQYHDDTEEMRATFPPAEDYVGEAGPELFVPDDTGTETDTGSDDTGQGLDNDADAGTVGAPPEKDSEVSTPEASGSRTKPPKA